jgi:hypothetical protein
MTTSQACQDGLHATCRGHLFRSHNDREGTACGCPCHASEPTKQRPGDQPLPVANQHPVIFDLVHVDLEGRKATGISRYGRALQPHNGRDALRDAYEESLDLAAYLRQCLYERDGR